MDNQETPLEVKTEKRRVQKDRKKAKKRKQLRANHAMLAQVSATQKPKVELFKANRNEDVACAPPHPMNSLTATDPAALAFLQRCAYM